MNVSIIIPVYQVAPYIKDCLRSVMRQTYTGSMECIMVDDCGSDESITIAEQMIAAYEGPVRFQILHHEQNRGLSAARNTGTMRAKGTYLYYLDSDDEMTEDCIETLMGQMTAHPELEMVQGNAIKHYPSIGSVVEIKQVTLPLTVTNEEVRKCMYQYNQMNFSLWNKLINRDFVIQNNLLCMEGILFEDILWSFNLLKVLKKTAFVSDVTYQYKKRPYSITMGTDKKTRVINYCVIYREILTHLTSGYEKEEIKYYIKIDAPYFLKYGHDVPDFRVVVNLCRVQCKRYCGFRSWMRFEVIYFLGKFKYGWVLWALARKVKRLVKNFFRIRGLLDPLTKERV